MHVLEVVLPIDHAGVERETSLVLQRQRVPERNDPFVRVDHLGLGVHPVEIRIPLHEVDASLVAVQA